MKDLKEFVEQLVKIEFLDHCNAFGFYPFQMFFFVHLQMKNKNKEKYDHRIVSSRSLSHARINEEINRLDYRLMLVDDFLWDYVDKLIILM